MVCSFPNHAFFKRFSAVFRGRCYPATSHYSKGPSPLSMLKKNCFCQIFWYWHFFSRHCPRFPPWFWQIILNICSYHTCTHENWQCKKGTHACRKYTFCPFGSPGELTVTPAHAILDEIRPLFAKADSSMGHNYNDSINFSFKKDLETIKSLPKEKRWKYIWDYYKKCLST